MSPVAFLGSDYRWSVTIPTEDANADREVLDSFLQRSQSPRPARPRSPRSRPATCWPSRRGGDTLGRRHPHRQVPDDLVRRGCDHEPVSEQVAVLDDYQRVAADFADWAMLQPDVEVAFFPDHVSDENALAECLADSTIVVAMRERTAFPRQLLERLPKLRLLVTTGMRNPAIDMSAARDLGVVVCGTTALPNPPAELTWGLVLGLCRHIAEEHQAIREGRWQVTVGDGLAGKVLGVIGLGRLGSQVARVGTAFGMDVIAWSQNLTYERCTEVGVRRAEKDELLSTADVVTIHLLLSDRTRGLIGRPELALMKPSSYLVNTSRAPIVDGDALLDALRSRRIAGAALDVFDTEPLPTDDPLRTLDNVLLTPHIGYVTRENYRLFYQQAVEDIAAFLHGEPTRVLNPG
jgi:phosphoglycerate dehydrogenase-like enzyme